MLKLHREMLKGLKAMDLTVLEHDIHKGHLHVTIRLPSGATRKLTGAGSPADAMYATHEFLQAAKRLIRADAQQPLKATS